MVAHFFEAGLGPQKCVDYQALSKQQGMAGQVYMISTFMDRNKPTRLLLADWDLFLDISL